ncbi:glycosyltransferase [Paenibacillus ihumii]|uniref:glycosyltransferase n=1 Tax=Paenibacillus ihumii TaxID=687436 RepID=UPI0006D825DE|nr:glycosyltransferase [Paenibacillus ihumii]
MSDSLKKVWMIAPTPFFSDRGCHVRILEEIYALKEQDITVDLFTYHLGRDIEGVHTIRTIKIPWYKKKSPGPSYHKLYLDVFLFITCLFRLFKSKNRPIVLHGHLHEGAFIAIFLKIFLKVPVIFDVQGSLVDELQSHKFIKKGKLLYKLFYSLESFIYKKSDHLIVSSKNTADFIIDNFKISEQKVTVIMDGVNSNWSSQLLEWNSRNKALNELGIPSGKIIIGYLGALNEYQGIDILLQTIKDISLSAEIGKLHFLIMGYPNVEKYKNTAKEMDIENHVTFTGKVAYETIGSLLSVADIAVSPKISLTEANGKIINYMAMGLPVVAFNTPVNQQYLGEDYRYFADINNKDSFKDCLLSLLSDGPDEWKNTGDNLKNRVVNEFNMGKIAEQILGVYKHENSNNNL